MTNVDSIFPQGAWQIFGKMADIQADIDFIGKDSKNTTQGWAFRGIDDCYNILHGILSTHRVVCVPHKIENLITTERETQRSVMRFTTMLITYRFYAPDGSFIDVQTASEAMDSGDKSCGKCHSYGHKYALIQTFSIPTAEDNDPDYTSHELKPATKAVGKSPITHETETVRQKTVAKTVPKPVPPKPDVVTTEQLNVLSATAQTKNVPYSVIIDQAKKTFKVAKIEDLKPDQYEKLLAALTRSLPAVTSTPAKTPPAPVSDIEEGQLPDDSEMEYDDIDYTEIEEDGDGE